METTLDEELQAEVEAQRLALASGIAMGRRIEEEKSMTEAIQNIREASLAATRKAFGEALMSYKLEGKLHRNKFAAIEATPNQIAAALVSFLREESWDEKVEFLMELTGEFEIELADYINDLEGMPVRRRMRKKGRGQGVT